MFQTTNQLAIVSPADGIFFIQWATSFFHLLPSKSHADGSSYKAGLAVGLWSSPRSNLTMAPWHHGGFEEPGFNRDFTVRKSDVTKQKSQNLQQNPQTFKKAGCFSTKKCVSSRKNQIPGYVSDGPTTIGFTQKDSTLFTRKMIMKHPKIFRINPNKKCDLKMRKKKSMTKCGSSHADSTSHVDPRLRRLHGGTPHKTRVLAWVFWSFNVVPPSFVGLLPI